MSDHLDPEKKNEYRKPDLREVELAAKEVLAIGCKVSGGGINAGSSPCDTGNCAVADLS